jgi:TRAP-type C4-dicarboxylate transport system substrate-binding protein
MQKIKLKWIIAHQPAYLFRRTAEEFKRIVNEESKDLQIDIEVLEAEEYNKKYTPTVPATRHNLFNMLQDGTVQVAQVLTSSLAAKFNQQMHVLDMPYIFESHEHAAEILEGPIGQKLLNQFTPESKLKGLAFTYSGGFRLLPLSQKAFSLADICGQKVRSGLAPQAVDTIAALGAEPVAADLEAANEMVRSGEVIGTEYVAQRIFPDNCDQWIESVLETNHSLFLTSIIVNVDWWNTLPQAVQNIFMKAALESARIERDLSIRDGEKSVEQLKASGVTFLSLTDSEKQNLKQKVENVYNKYNNGYFESGLVESIRRH